MTDFNAAIDEAKGLETKTLGYTPYKGKVVIEKTLDLEPSEYADFTYQDLLNLYERDKKIISTQAMGILAGVAEKEAATPASQEMETKLREMTSQTLHQAEEVAKEPITLEREVPAVAEPSQERIEFETRTVSEIHEEAKEAGTEEQSKEHEASVRQQQAGELQEPSEMPAEKKVIIANVPPALKESPDEAAREKYGRMEGQVRSMLGEQADEMTLKRKMLELTKELFKEKESNRREELKLQITVMKNMLTGARAPTREKSAHSKILETLAGTQQADLVQTKDSIMESYRKQVQAIRSRFYSDLEATDDQARKKQLLESFVFSITSLVEQLPEVIGKYRDSIARKHRAELENLKDSLDPGEKVLLAKVNGIVGCIDSDYGREFATVKEIVGKEIESMIDVAGADVFKKPEGKQDMHDIIREINETDAGTLLYYLHSHDPAYYKKYERMQLSKSEALFKAKELVALEKGLSAATVKRYFSQKED